MALILTMNWTPLSFALLALALLFAVLAIALPDGEGDDEVPILDVQNHKGDR